MIRKSKTLKTYFYQGIYTYNGAMAQRYNGTTVQRYNGVTIQGISDERAGRREDGRARRCDTTLPFYNIIYAGDLTCFLFGINLYGAAAKVSPMGN
jgi:hypothetical protein